MWGATCLFDGWQTSRPCLAQVGINADLTISRLSWAFCFPGEIRDTTILCDQYYARTAARGQLRECRLIARSEYHHSTYVRSSIIDDISPLYRLPTPGVSTPSHMLTILSTFSDFLDCHLHQRDYQQSNNKLVEVMGLIPLFLSCHVLFTHFNISF